MYPLRRVYHSNQACIDMACYTIIIAFVRQVCYYIIKVLYKLSFEVPFFGARVARLYFPSLLSLALAL